jgi:hypothetical protein
MTLWRHRTVLHSLPCAVISLACSGPFDDERDVRVWATTASAAAVYSHAVQPLAVADHSGSYTDPACPEVTSYGNGVRIAGGCTDRGGRTWVGLATVGVLPYAQDVSFEGFGSYLGGELAAALTGRVGVMGRAESERQFYVDLVQVGGTLTMFHYRGTLTGRHGQRTLWNGRGSVERDGSVEPSGRVDARTIDQLIDESVCAGQPLSGRTLLQGDSQKAIIEYDGASDCDEARAARWSVDGEDRGSLAGL